MLKQLIFNFNKPDSERLYKLIEVSYYEQKKLLKICTSAKTRSFVENDIRILKSFINQYLNNSEVL